MIDKYDYYKLLNVGRLASQAEIRVAYRRLARQYHPDVNSHTGAEEHFKELNEAYEVLSDQQKRSLYDLYGHAGLSRGITSPDVGVGDILDELFQQYVRTNNASRFSGKWAGSDLNISVEIGFEEAVRGTQVTLSLERYEACPTCYGTGLNHPTLCMRCEGSGKLNSSDTSIPKNADANDKNSHKHNHNNESCPYCRGVGQVVRGQCRVCYGERRERVKVPLKVNIPAGIIDRMRIKVDGEGDKGLGGGPAGDLYVEVHVRSHPYLHRDGLNIMLGLEVNLAQVILGEEIDIPTVYGRERIVIARGTQNKQLIRLPGKGIPDIYQQQPIGDMIIQVSVQDPSDLSQAQRQLIYMLFGSSSHRFISHESAPAKNPNINGVKSNSSPPPIKPIDLHLRLSQQAQQIHMDLIIQDQAINLPLTTPPHKMAQFASYLQQDSHNIADSVSQVIESAVEHVETAELRQDDYPIFYHLLKKLEHRQSHSTHSS